MGVLGLLLCCGTAGAQLSMPALLSEAMQSEFVRRDLMHINQDLDLDSGQRAVVQGLFLDYEAAVHQGVTHVREQLRQVHPSMAEDDAAREKRQQEMRDRVQELLKEVQQPDAADAADPEQLRERIRQRTEALRAQFKQQPQELAPEHAHQVWKDSLEILDRWRGQKATLGERFMNDVRANLRADQQPRWEPLQRKLRRLKQLPRGRLSGESADLLMILREITGDHEAPQTLADILEQYETRLDEALFRRERFVEGLPRQLLAVAPDQGTFDQAALEAIVQELVQRHVHVRDINEEFAISIAAALGGDDSARFVSTYRARSFPRVFRWTHVQRVLRAASQLEGLDQPSREAVASLETECLAELASLNEQLMRAVVAHEPAELRERIEAQAQRHFGQAALRDPQGLPTVIVGQGGLGAATGAAKLGEEFGHRMQREQAYLDRLVTMLPPDLFEKLPANRPAHAELGPAAEVSSNGNTITNEMPREE